MRDVGTTPASEAGAIGGKLLGAGGTGFLLLFVERNKQSSVRKALGKLIEQRLSIEQEGSRIIYVGNSWHKEKVEDNYEFDRSY